MVREARDVANIGPHRGASRRKKRGELASVPSGPPFRSSGSEGARSIWEISAGGTAAYHEYGASFGGMLTTMVCGRVISSMDAPMPSRPMPDFLLPPNGKWPTPCAG